MVHIKESFKRKKEKKLLVLNTCSCIEDFVHKVLLWCWGSPCLDRLSPAAAKMSAGLQLGDGGWRERQQLSLPLPLTYSSEVQCPVMTWGSCENATQTTSSNWLCKPLKVSADGLPEFRCWWHMGQSLKKVCLPPEKEFSLQHIQWNRERLGLGPMDNEGADCGLHMQEQNGVSVQNWTWQERLWS